MAPAVLKVRTEMELGRRQRDIRVSSLPLAMCDAIDGNAFRFLLAAEQAGPGAAMGPQAFLSLHRAAQTTDSHTCQWIDSDETIESFRECGRDRPPT